MKKKEKDSSTVVIPELTGYVGTAGSNVAVRLIFVPTGLIKQIMWS